MTAFHRCARYSADKKLFICENAEQAAQLEARGWKPLPDYPPNEAMWVQSFPEAGEAPKAAPAAPPSDDPPPAPKKPGRKPKA